MKFNISLRARIIIFSALLTFVWAVPLVSDLNRILPIPDNLYLRSLFISIFSYLCLWVILGFGKSIIKHVVVLLPVAFSIFLVSLFLYFLVPKLTERFIYQTMAAVVIASFGLFLYVSSLMANILYKSIDDPLPLVKAARTALYIISLVTIFISSALFLSIRINTLVAVVIVLFVISFYIFINLWYTDLSNKEALRYTSLGVLVVGFLLFVLINWPLNVSLIALSLTLIIYMYLGLIFNVLNGTFTKSIWIEYIVIAVLISYVLLKFSEWGINKIPFIQ